MGKYDTYFKVITIVLIVGYLIYKGYFEDNDNDDDYEPFLK